jgi:serine phosphatase RsbU (regulator of sigma subunit)
MFVTSGPVPPESRLFVGRAAELKRMETWLADVNCVGAVLGARQTGKTSLLLKLRHAFRDKYAFAFVNLQGIEGAEAQECFSYIAEQMVEQLAETINNEALPALPTDNKTFSTFLREFSRKTRAVRVIVILDEIGTLPPQTTIKLASTIRAVFTDRFVKPELARYMFLLAGATDMLELTTGRNSPLANVTEKIYLGDLSLEESGQLLAEPFGCAGSRPFAKVNQRLHNWTSGHPYWTQLLAANLVGRPLAPTEKAIKDVVEQLLRTEDRNLPHVIRLLKADEALWSLVESLLDGVPLRFSRANAAIAKLELIGILKDQDGRCTIRNRIYQEAVHSHQIKPIRLPAANLKILSQLLVTCTDQQSLLREVAAFLQQVFQSRTVVIFTERPRDLNFRASASVGVAKRLCAELVFTAGSRLLEMLDHGVEPSIRDLPESEKVQLGTISSALLIAIRLKDSLSGFLSLGEKLSGEEYDAQDREFLAAVAERVASAIELMSLNQWKQDAESAREMQQELLPKEIPQVPGFQISGAWQPARLVSGDYYDVLKFDERKVALCIGDVVGKGMPAALLMSNLQAAVKAFASASVPPERLCEQVNRLTSNNIARGKFVTFFYAMIDAETRRLMYTNAGHNPPILVRHDGAVLRLEEGGALLGVFPDWEYRQGQVELASGDRLLLFTDGVSEVEDSEGHQFGEERLIGLLKDSCDLGAADLQQKVIETVTQFSHGNFHDDVTLLTLAVQ